MDAEQFLATAAEARRLAGGLTDRLDAGKLLAYAEECEIAAVLDRMGELGFEDVPVPPCFGPPQRPPVARVHLALVR